jgi:hypothetical protein
VAPPPRPMGKCPGGVLPDSEGPCETHIRSGTGGTALCGQ